MFLQDGKIYVILHKQAKKDDYLKSYIHALVAASLLDNPNIEDAEISSNVWMQNSYPIFMLEVTGKCLCSLSGHSHNMV